MKILFIGGTGTISLAITQQLCEQNHDIYLINRGTRNQSLPSNINLIKGDINDEELIADAIKDLTFDVVADFIAFLPEHVERDYRLFHNKTKQYIFVTKVVQCA